MKGIIVQYSMKIVAGFKRILVLLKFVLLVLALSAFQNVKAQTQKPNIIFILADDLGFETLECNGGESYKTPYLNKMAQAGMRFTNAHATPLCTPSRIQLMTGKYNFRNYKGFAILDSMETTFGHLLKDAGYVTGITGKWQLFGDAGQQKLARQKGVFPQNSGFDEYFVWQVKTKNSRYKNPGIYSNLGEKVYAGKYGPDLFTDFAKDFIRKHREKPFFLYYPMVLTHNPFQPTPDDAGYTDFDPDSKVDNPAYFGSMVAFIDKKVGEIIKQVEDAGISQNTLIIFTGDNGTDTQITSKMNGREIKGGKGYPKITGTHVPFIAQWKGVIHPGKVNDNLVDFTDLLPTFMQVARAKIPANFKTDGLSFLAQLQGKAKAPARDWIYCSYDPHWQNFKPATWMHNKQWKLYRTGQLYNIAQDPEELKPITGKDLSLEAQAIQKKFEKAMAQLQ